ncbi:transcriptional regulator family: Fungal Specific TF [Paecilomyces variotii]|nr:transcriptional regulator family: Fungal Specific TF [Paecilomyces variotii]KAJ9275323.1 transcriptional regulator family: Fungal Specific TF [Paecilomyces variotii]KAJ9327313.1 transcriptional regulator family: Fungal Specific TF [Paecilomyces variotii]KAJ9330908.1 transcriptional regulator family: Fungal Specific TF [Paecilomyces variotii]KAJ9338251.1 transcriptional regulator family: Fungal Specific TF [Paecilomyces variotii]
MASQPSSVHSSAGENEDDPTAISEYHVQDDGDTSPAQDSLGKDESALGSQQKQAHPMQKRRRVTRACDECRRKKIKCDGKQPCTHCTVYSYECTYDQPSNRRRNPAPQYIEALESRLHKAEALLRVVLPDLNLDDPRFDVHAAEQVLAAVKKEKAGLPKPPSTSTNQPEPATDNGDESLLETMVENSGCLDLDDQGHWDYHGHSSGIIFMQRLRKQLGNSVVPELKPSPKTRPISHYLESPKSASASESPHDANLPPTQDLPPKAVARKLCHNAFYDACALMRFVHEPSFYATFDRIYDTPPEQFTNEEHAFLPLLYIVLSVGCLFSNDLDSTLDIAGYESAIGQGFQYWKAGRQLIDITDCRDLTSLQAICFMVLFLQSSAKLSTCYSYVGIALRAALRLGLHRSVTANFNPIERELRKRIFWVIRKMDVYVSTLLGLPQMLSDQDIDQEYPLSVDDEFITADAILPMPPGRVSLMEGANAHSRLVNIIVKVVKYIYPVKNAKHRSKNDQTYMVSHSKIREIERDLQAWMEELPSALRPGEEAGPELERIRQLLRISYAHVQIVMYRPFLHYVSSGIQSRGIDKRSYACAAACVSVSRNVVHITAGMYKRGFLNGSFWFTMYTTYFAILSLIFFVLENPDSPTAKDGVLKDALEGKNTLAGLAKKSMAADRCSQSLNCLFKNLPEKLKKRQSSAAPLNLKRPSPSIIPTKVRSIQAPTEPGARPNGTAFGAPQRASTFPTQLARQMATTDAANTVDDSHAYKRSPRSWLTNGISTLSGEPMSVSSAFVNQSPATSPISASLAGPAQQQQGRSQSFENSANLPDLMPIMFPSGDPFMYPAQPMSTLEDDHFKNDNSAAAGQYGFQSASLQSTPTSARMPTLDASTPVYDGFANVPVFPSGPPAGTAAALPPHLQHLNQQAGQSRVQSPPSNASTPGGDMVQSPDLVSIPNQNFSWQGFSFQPQVPSNDQQSQPRISGAGGSQNVGMDVDNFSALGGIDMGMNFDELFGNAITGTAGTAGAEDWGQWTNASI